MTAHWEFAYGPEAFKQRAAELIYPMLAINVFCQATKERLFPPYNVKEIGGLREVEGIDVCLSGHTHNRLYKPALQGKTLIIQSGCHGSFLGCLDLEIEGGRVVDYRHQLIEVEDIITPDPDESADFNGRADGRGNCRDAGGISGTNVCPRHLVR